MGNKNPRQLAVPFVMVVLRRQCDAMATIGMAHCFKYPLHNLTNIFTPLTQVGVINIVKLFGHRLVLLHQGPFGIAVFRQDTIAGRFNQQWVMQNDCLQIKKCPKLGGNFFPQVLAHAFEFFIDTADRCVESLDFLMALFRRKMVAAIGQDVPDQGWVRGACVG